MEDKRLIECLQIENDSFKRLHKDNIRFQESLIIRGTRYQEEIEVLQSKLRKNFNDIGLFIKDLKENVEGWENGERETTLQFIIDSIKNKYFKGGLN